VTCEDLVTPENGVYQFSTDGTTTTGQLQCNDGYEASGTTEIYCGSDGEWRYNQRSTCGNYVSLIIVIDVFVNILIVCEFILLL
jgi:hypothetical protein